MAKNSTIRSVKGMNDILPAEARKWRHLETTFVDLVQRYGYGEVRTPLVEPTALFVRSIGEVTDIVEKEMYTFADRGKKSLTLRPEGTASCVRAYLQHKVHALEPTSKWFYMGPMYRRERPAKGRYRQFYQVGCEAYGDLGPHIDAEMIDLAVTFVQALGIRKVRVLVNSLGSGETRVRYRDALLAYLRPLEASLSEDSKRRLEQNPLRVLDSKAPCDQEIAANAPNILDFLSEDDQTHFDGLKAALDALGTPYEVAPRLVRGLDYYNRTLFEVKAVEADLGSQDTVCGGGRYDGMIEELGGSSVPAIGFGMGIERLLLSMGDVDLGSTLDVFLIIGGKEHRQAALCFAQSLRKAGLRVDADLRGGSFKSQFRRADKSGAAWALVLGDAEVLAGTVQVKDLAKSSQEELSQDDVAQVLLARKNGEKQ